MVQPRELVAKFASETNVFGLHLFASQRSHFEVVFWCLFVAIFAGYTAKTVVSLTQKFMDEETVTNVQEMKDENFSFPYAQMCFAALPFVEALPFTEGVRLAAEKLVGNGSNAGLNASAFVSAMNFLLQLQRAEIELPKARLLNESLLAGLRSLAKYPKIRLSELSDFLVRELCRSLQLTVFFSVNAKPRDVQQNVCDVGDPTTSLLLAQPQLLFCVDPQRVGLVFKSGVDQLTITFNPSKADRLGVKIVMGQFWLNNVISLGADLFAPESVVIVAIGKTQVHQLSVKTARKNLDLRRRPCTDDRTRSTWCKSLFASRSFYAAFGCWPLFAHYQLSPLRQNISNVRSCEIDVDYLYFGRSASVLDNIIRRARECIDGCVEPCTKYVYSFTTTDVEMQSNVTSSRFVVESFVYYVFEERLANDFESFLSNFGGAIGLFLGMSFATFVHALLFLVQAVASYFSRKMKTSTENDVEIVPIDLSAGAVEEPGAIPAGLDGILKDIVARLQSVEKKTNAAKGSSLPYVYFC